MRSSKRTQGFFVKKPSVLLSSDGTAGSCEYSKQSEKEKSQSWKKPTLAVFVKEPSVLLSSAGITTTSSHLQGSRHIWTFFHCDYAKCTEVVFTQSLYTVDVNSNIKTLEKKEKVSALENNNISEKFKSGTKSVWIIVDESARAKTV